MIRVIALTLALSQRERDDELCGFVQDNYRAIKRLAAKENLPAGVSIELLPPKKTTDLARFFYAMPAGDRMPDWQLGIKWNDDSLAGAAARSKIIAYVLAGSFAVSAASVLAFWVAMSFRRQMQLARLKNDLVAAVSHELKTPLASIRLLVDTLLAEGGDCPNFRVNENGTVPLAEPKRGKAQFARSTRRPLRQRYLSPFSRLASTWS